MLSNHSQSPTPQPENFLETDDAHDALIAALRAHQTGNASAYRAAHAELLQLRALHQEAA